jgi:DNA-binding MarR family transcriptional regulator
VTEFAPLFSELIRFETQLWNAVDARLRVDCDLPLSRFEPMQVIARRQACRVYDIADELSITVGGTSKLIDRIEASGYCRRRPNPEDRRSSIIQLTAAGRRVLAKATTSFESELQIWFGSVTSERQLHQFTMTLKKLRGAAEARALEATPHQQVS